MVKGIVIFVLALAILTILICLYLLRRMQPMVPKASSDVEVVSDIGTWPHQGGLSITKLDVEVVHAHLNIFNGKALVRFRIQGQVSASSNLWRPKIGKVQISERWTSAVGNQPLSNPSGDLLLVPIVEVEQIASYQADTPVPFDIKIEKIVSSLGWALSNYTVRCGAFEKAFTLHRTK